MQNLLAATFVLCAATPLIAFAQIHKCGETSQFHPAGVGLEITGAEAKPASPANTMRISPQFAGTIAVEVPAFCRVNGMVDKRTGVDGKQYGIGFALALPDNWNGRFLFQGGGGLNGTVADPIGAGAAGIAPALARGFAVVATDSGHKGSVFDGSFFRDQQASLDFYYVAIGRVAALAKQMIAWYYGRPAERSYYDGCSTGGREGMIMSQRYPTYFDGIIAGAPAMRTGLSNLALAYIGSVFAEAAAKGGGKADAKTLLSDSDRKLVIDALLNACDGKDGLKDGMIFNRRACDFDPAILSCKGEKTDSCLTRTQITALNTAFAGPKTSQGYQVYPGFAWDTGMNEHAGLPGLLNGPFIPVPLPASTGPYDVDTQAQRVFANPSTLLGDSTWTNLSTFAARGKLLFYHGMSDPWFSALDTAGYYERMSRDTASAQPAPSWSRLFLVPGMGHCGGGSATLDQFDMLTAVVNWVEKGEAPDRVIATGRTFPGRSRPLCPYPQHAQYSGHGDPNDASSFTCQE